MKVIEVLETLNAVELHQIHRDDGMNEVISYLNFALKVVYSRADIIVKMYPIQVEPNITIYDLPSDIIRIISIHDPLTGIEVPLNDDGSPDVPSIFTRGAYSLQVPISTGYKQLELLISASPPRITIDNHETVDFSIPDAFIEPIVNYAAYRAYKSHNVDDRSATSSLWRIFVMSLQDAINTGVLHNRVSTSQLLENRGFA